jgi:2,3-bisphosphoglycerate-dependent phosphoglycerate mutase
VTRLVLVRHGESQVFVDRVVGGLLTCSGLSDLGRRQAEALRERLAGTHELDPVDVLYASTMPRARETAEIIAPALGGLTVREDEGLCERHPGQADGMDWDEALAQFGNDDWEDDPSVVFSPGGESWTEFHERVSSTLERLAANHGDHTVVVACHGGVVDVAMRALLRLPMTGAFELATDNTAMTEFVLLPEREKRAARWRLIRYNDAAHLNGVI